MIDTHAHLHDRAFEDDLDAVIARARAAGVHGFITVGTDLATSHQAISLANSQEMAVAIGIHPHEAIDAPQDLRAAFAPLRAQAQHLVAIGEIGLDFHYDHSPRDRQAEVLRAQLILAGEYQLPVIFHEREALEAFVEILTEERQRRVANGIAPLRGVIHCFTRDTEAAKIYTQEFGLMLGIGGVLTFKTAQDLREAVQAVGIEHLILETDCPYLAPMPHRGKRNEPAFIAETTTRLAEILNLDRDHVITKTTENAQRLFGTIERPAP